MPKCSSCIVFRPIDAVPRRATILEYGALTRNVTCSCTLVLPHRVKTSRLTVIPSRAASFSSSCTRASSLASRQPPIKVRCTRLAPVLYSGCLSKRMLRACSCLACSFSGLGGVSATSSMRCTRPDLPELGQRHQLSLTRTQLSKLGEFGRVARRIYHLTDRLALSRIPGSIVL